MFDYSNGDIPNIFDGTVIFAKLENNTNNKQFKKISHLLNLNVFKRQNADIKLEKSHIR